MNTIRTRRGLLSNLDKLKRTTTRVEREAFESQATQAYCLQLQLIAKMVEMLMTEVICDPRG